MVVLSLDLESLMMATHKAIELNIENDGMFYTVEQYKVKGKVKSRVCRLSQTLVNLSRSNVN